MIETDCGTTGYGATPCGVPLNKLHVSKKQVQEFIANSISVLQTAKNAAEFDGTLKALVECAMAWSVQGGSDRYDYVDYALAAIPASARYTSLRRQLQIAKDVNGLLPLFIRDINESSDRGNGNILNVGSDLIDAIYAYRYLSKEAARKVFDGILRRNLSLHSVYLAHLGLIGEFAILANNKDVLGDDLLAELNEHVLNQVAAVAGGGAGTLSASIRKLAVQQMRKNFLSTLKGYKTAVIGGKTCVYTCEIDGVTRYVGITDDILRRGAEHFRQRGLVIEEFEGLQSLTRTDARAVEQVLINYHGLGSKGGTLLNKINSISKVRNQTAYERALVRGTELLRRANYPGFN